MTPPWFGSWQEYAPPVPPHYQWRTKLESAGYKVDEVPWEDSRVTPERSS